MTINLKNRLKPVKVTNIFSSLRHLALNIMEHAYRAVT